MVVGGGRGGRAGGRGSSRGEGAVPAEGEGVVGVGGQEGRYGEVVGGVGQVGGQVTGEGLGQGRGGELGHVGRREARLIGGKVGVHARLGAAGGGRRGCERTAHKEERVRLPRQHHALLHKTQVRPRSGQVKNTRWHMTGRTY